jgi:hypothetical protein
MSNDDRKTDVNIKNVAGVWKALDSLADTVREWFEFIREHSRDPEMVNEGGNPPPPTAVTRAVSISDAKIPDTTVGVQEVLETLPQALEAWSNLARSLRLLDLQITCWSDKNRVREAFCITYAIYRTRNLEVKWIKTHLVALANKILGQPAPEPDQIWLDAARRGLGEERWGVPFVGCGYSAIQRWLRTKASTFHAFSLLQAKGIFPAPTEQFVEDAVQQTFNRLTRPQTIPDLGPGCDCGRGTTCFACGSDPDTDYFWVGRLRAEIEAQATNFGRRCAADKIRDLPLPSAHGHIAPCGAPIARKNGGALGLFHAERELWVESCPCGDSLMSPTGAHYKFSGFHDMSSLEHICNVSYAASALRAYAMRKTVLDSAEGPVSERRVAQILADRRVKLTGLQEPLKARVISLGTPQRYYRQKLLQVHMHAVLRKYDRFELTGKPLDARALNWANPRFWEQLLLPQSLHEEDDMEPGAMAPTIGFLSGDYADATNMMRGWASRVAGRAIGLAWEAGGGVDILEDLEEGLVDNLILDPREDGTLAAQTEGQLMGAPVSFPVLCLVNSAVITIAYQRFLYETDCAYVRGRSVRWSHGPHKGKVIGPGALPFRVNGDDCVMVCPAAFMEVWEQVAAWAGLYSSVGKSYWSPDWLLMNSAAYELNRSDPAYLGLPSLMGLESRLFRRAQFLPLGSMFPSCERGAERRHVCGSTGIELVDVVGPRARWAVLNCPPDRRDNVLREMIRFYDLPGSKQLDNFSWWLPSSLGGLGLPPPTFSASAYLDLCSWRYIARARESVRDERLAPLAVEILDQERFQSDARVHSSFVVPSAGNGDPFSGLGRGGCDYSPLLLGMDESRQGKRQRFMERQERGARLSPQYLAWMCNYSRIADDWIRSSKCPENALLTALQPGGELEALLNNCGTGQPLAEFRVLISDTTDRFNEPRIRAGRHRRPRLGYFPGGILPPTSSNPSDPTVVGDETPMCMPPEFTYESFRKPFLTRPYPRTAL